MIGRRQRTEGVYRLSRGGGFAVRPQAVQNTIVAEHMNDFFDELSRGKYGYANSRKRLAQAYCAHLFHGRQLKLIDEKKFSRSQFHVALGVKSGTLDDITKRSVLVSDTLLISHAQENQPQPIGAVFKKKGEVRVGLHGSGLPTRSEGYKRILSIKCPDIASLGEWIADAEPLLRAGLAWYLPTYSISVGRNHWAEIGKNRPVPVGSSRVPSFLDFLAVNRKAIEASGSHPLESRVIRPVLEINLPFIDGVNLRDFSQITASEFGSYVGFRSFLRQAFLDLDDAVNAVHSDHGLMKIGHQIEDEIRGMQSRMGAVRRRRAVAATGAGVGTIGATLVAVYGPAFQQAITVLGAAGAGGVWGVLQATSENSPQSLKEDRWYYIWSLAKRSKIYGF